MLAGIGRPWDTVTSRSIPIRMHRASRGELRPIQKIRHDRLAQSCEPLRRQALRWAADHRAELLGADPDVPDELGARQADVWRPLLAIADVADQDRPVADWGETLSATSWSDASRAAAKALHGVAEEEGDYGLLLLGDVRRIVRTHQLADRFDGAGIFTATLIEDLVALGEASPWQEFTPDGRPITPRKLASLLGRFGIKPDDVRNGTIVRKGYTYSNLEPLFKCYLPVEPALIGKSPPCNPLHPLQRPM